MAARGQSDRLALVLVDRGVSERGARGIGNQHDLEVRIVHHDGPRGTFEPLPFAWRVEVAHSLLLRSRRLSRSFENTLDSASGWLQVACIAAVLDALVASPRKLRAARRRRAAKVASRRSSPGEPTAAAT